MIPLDVCFYKVGMVSNCTKQVLWKRLRFFADCLCLLDVVITFFTGYLDDRRKVVIMDPKAICMYVVYEISYSNRSTFIFLEITW